MAGADCSIHVSVPGKRGFGSCPMDVADGFGQGMAESGPASSP